MITVSVITTFYNSSNYISRSINSIIKQKSDIIIDYLLVDDCSTDNTLTIVNDIISNSKIPDNIKVRVLQTPKNFGCGGARKFGIDNSIGDYLMFLDADDYYINSDFIDRAAHDIITNNADIIEYGVIYHKFNGDIIPNHVESPLTLINEDRINSMALILLFDQNFIKFNVWTKIIKRSLTDQFPYSTKRTFEDVDTIPVWVSLANKIVIMPTCEINYSINKKSIIRYNIYNTRINTLKSMLAHFKRFKDNQQVLIAIYKRALMDLEVLLNNKCSDDPYFNEASKLNTSMLSYIYPKTYENMTFNL